MPTSSTNFYTAASNQVTSSTLGALTYDQAGDVIGDGMNSYLYDAEGRLCAVKNQSGAMTGYVYDAGGIRVAKAALTSFSCNFASNGFPSTASWTGTSWVLGLGSEQVTEYSVSAGASTWQHTNVFASGALLASYYGTDTYFALNDWLGTKRVELNATNTCETGFRSLQFGDGYASFALSSSLPACLDATEQHFTGKERDAESGNDYFPARYYASSMGRFMSPDPSGLVFADPSNPQSLNLYSYVRNNPLLLVDPTGLFCYQVNSSTVTIDNKAQNAGQCAKGATWIDGTATNYSYGTDGVLQVGFSQAGGTGTLSFSSSDLSTDSSGNIQNPWGISLSDMNKYGGGQLGQSGNLNRYKSRLFGMHWCGPGGGGPTTSANDAACRQHDADYAAAGASADMNTGKATPTPDQIRAMAAANQKMLNAVLKNPGEVSTPFLELWLTGGVGSIYPGTEAHYPEVQLSSPQAPSTNFGQWTAVP